MDYYERALVILTGVLTATSSPVIILNDFFKGNLSYSKTLELRKDFADNLLSIAKDDRKRKEFFHCLQKVSFGENVQQPRVREIEAVARRAFKNQTLLNRVPETGTQTGRLGWKHRE
jgi:hypothetical protein